MGCVDQHNQIHSVCCPRSTVQAPRPISSARSCPPMCMRVCRRPGRRRGVCSSAAPTTRHAGGARCDRGRRGRTALPAMRSMRSRPTSIGASACRSTISAARPAGRTDPYPALLPTARCRRPDRGTPRTSGGRRSTGASCLTATSSAPVRIAASRRARHQCDACGTCSIPRTSCSRARRRQATRASNCAGPVTVPAPSLLVERLDAWVGTRTGWRRS